MSNNLSASRIENRHPGKHLVVSQKLHHVLGGQPVGGDPRWDTHPVCMDVLKNTRFNGNPSRLNCWDSFEQRQSKQLLQGIVMLSGVANGRNRLQKSLHC